MIATLPPARVPAKNDISTIVYREDAMHSSFWRQNSAVIPEPSASTFWTRERRFIELSESANKAKAFEEGWDGYEAPAPNNVSLARTLEVLSRLRDSRLNPYSVLPSADGGIGISFRGRDDKRAVLEFLNDDTSSYSLYGKGHSTESAEFNLNTDLQGIIKRLEEYL